MIFPGGSLAAAFVGGLRCGNSTTTMTMNPSSASMSTSRKTVPSWPDSKSSNSDIPLTAGDQMGGEPGGTDGEEMIVGAQPQVQHRSEEHTSELQSLMRISYAVFCL